MRLIHSGIYVFGLMPGKFSLCKLDIACRASIYIISQCKFNHTVITCIEWANIDRIYSPTVKPRQISSTSTFTRSSHHSAPCTLQHAQHSTGYPCMSPIEIKTAGIDKLISELDEHKACGPDGIRPIIQKRLRASISPTLQCIFSKSLAEGQVPDDLKHANVTHYTRKETETTLPTTDLFP